jgi:hypothetical protein
MSEDAKNETGKVKEPWETFGFMDEAHYYQFMKLINNSTSGDTYMGSMGTGGPLNSGFGGPIGYDGGHYLNPFKMAFDLGKMTTEFDKYCDDLLDKCDDGSGINKCEIERLINQAKAIIEFVSAGVFNGMAGTNKLFSEKKKDEDKKK